MKSGTMGTEHTIGLAAARRRDGELGGQSDCRSRPIWPSLVPLGAGVIGPCAGEGVSGPSHRPGGTTGWEWREMANRERKAVEEVGGGWSTSVDMEGHRGCRADHVHLHEMRALSFLRLFETVHSKPSTFRVRCGRRPLRRGIHRSSGASSQLRGNVPSRRP